MKRYGAFRRLCPRSARAGRLRQRQQQRAAARRRTSSTATSSGGGKTIAFLLPENKTARYESPDRPLFEAKVKELCPDCKILYSNADQDASKQQQQAEAALTQGVKVMVLDPVDGAAAAAIVNQANAKNVPVISYDRLLLNSKPDYYVEFDSPSVGKIQGQALVDKLKADGKKGSIVMINGAPTDNNAKLFKQGAHSRASTRAASRSPRSTTRPTGRPTRPSRRWSRRSRRSARTASSASTPPTTAPAAARSRR